MAFVVDDLDVVQVLDDAAKLDWSVRRWADGEVRREMVSWDLILPYDLCSARGLIDGMMKRSMCWRQQSIDASFWVASGSISE